MKKVIRSASVADEEMLRYAQDIHKKAEALLSTLDNAPENVLNGLYLNDLHDRLNEDVPDLALTINTMMGSKKPKYEDMW